MESNKPAKKSALLRIWNALLYSLEGVAQAWRDEQAFRQELVLFILLVPPAVLIPISLPIRLLVVFSMVLVLVVELINSSIEAVTDLVTKDFQELAKKAKDCASAAVFVSLLLCSSMWGVALYQWLAV